MLSCAGHRRKSSANGCVVPSGVEAVARGLDFLKFGFVLTADGIESISKDTVDCQVQSLDAGTFVSSWAPMPQATWTVMSCDELDEPEPVLTSADLGGSSSSSSPPPPRHRRLRAKCEAFVPELDKEREYTLRLLVSGDNAEIFECTETFTMRTAGRPRSELARLHLLSRKATVIEFEWTVVDPPGSPVLDCEIQYRLEGMLGGWVPARCNNQAMDPAPVSENTKSAGSSSSGAGRRWKGVLEGLTGATHYRLRIRARNLVGSSFLWSPELACATSNKPSAPKDLTCVRRTPDTLTLECEVDDPEGAPVVDCSVEVASIAGVGFARHSECSLDRPPPAVTSDGSHRGSCRKWVITMTGLAAETLYTVRIRAHNDCGASDHASLVLQAATSHRPHPPQLEEAHVGPKSLEVTYMIADPDSAPVQSCEVEYCRAGIFSSWEVIMAQPMHWPGSDEQHEGRPLRKSASALLLTALGPASTDDDASNARRSQNCLARAWKARIEGLDRETTYHVRAKAHNPVGCSISSSASTTLKTTDKPLRADDVVCIARLPDAVKLRCKVSDILGTDPVTGMVAEYSGQVSWHEVSEVRAKRDDSQPADVSNVGVTTTWILLVNLGISPDVDHRLRLWSTNSFGRSSHPSEICVCRTSDRPRPPKDVRCTQRMPYSVVLEWTATDPEGAPIYRYEVHARKSQALSTWHPRACLTCYRAEESSQTWRCLVEELDPAAAYRFSIRAKNAVGWSDWHTCEGDFETSSLTSIGTMKVHMIPCPPEMAAATGGEQPLPAPLSPESSVHSSFLQGPASVSTLTLSSKLPDGVECAAALEVSLSDPEGAPVVACIMRCHEQGDWVLGTRLASSASEAQCTWYAVVPMPAEAGKDKKPLSFELHAANAVGWFCHSESHVPQGVSTLEPVKNSAYSAVDLMHVQIREAVVTQTKVKERVQEVLVDAVARGDQEHAGVLEAFALEVDNRIAVLERVAAEVDPVAVRFSEDEGAELATLFKAALQKYKVVPSAAAAANLLSLVLRGYMWLEKSWRPELLSMSEGMSAITGKLLESQSPGRILHQWAKQHQTWSANFDSKVKRALPEGFATAAKLIATLACGQKSQLFESVRADLVACSTLVTTAEKQLKRLRQSYRILHASETSSQHDFKGKGVMHKIETTALGLITMLVLPMPGSIEIGTLGIGMLWLEGDEAGSHLALEHPSGTPLAPFLERLGASPPPRAAVIISGWASGGHPGVVLVHNATPRRITAALLPAKDNMALVAASRLAEAHPMLRIAKSSMSMASGGDHIVTILPTSVALIQVPMKRTSGKGAQAAEVAVQEQVRLEFSYGSAAVPEKAIGRATIRAGSAISFMALESSLQVSNVDDGEAEDGVESGLRVINNDLSPVELSLYRAPEVRMRFESAVATSIIQANEQKQLHLDASSYSSIFEAEVRYEGGKKASCELRPGQCLRIEPCG